eukprot:6210446-Pleurochrysis_carterae.AAC.2
MVTAIDEERSRREAVLGQLREENDTIDRCAIQSACDSKQSAANPSDESSPTSPRLARLHERTHAHTTTLSHTRTNVYASARASTHRRSHVHSPNGIFKVGARNHKRGCFTQ